ncbi:hypothetical protein [Breoghania sp. L-A4]|uniref:hypothetical protein n=1 Tax=Breoghania sp. L-A4 TaxID=2304600 RepID=UPI000E35D7D4|nr:hypothetical protein [Breoghania sp. L-A4]AXS38773.1 hypothetical protein D1F64_00265 [Breoghania sp. L-A4]
MEPLTAKRNKLTSAIKKLKSEGYTAGQTGVAWGWYSLSPKWSNLWPSDSAPGEYDDEDVVKFLIFMTDGDFNTNYYFGGPPCNYRTRYGIQFDSGKYYSGQCVDYDHKSYSNKKNYTDRWQEEPEKENSTNVSSTRAKKICAEAKKTGASLYSIYFGSNDNSAGAKVMQACATDVNTTYYFAKDANNLIAAFQAISSKIKGVYLSK